MNNDLIQNIYEIYRACRLCGARAGYKMPIIQTMIDDGEGMKLSKKIMDCVQIQVTENDRMPPLICEPCVDKISDFHEFRVMCQETNTKTRLRLGLPLEDVPRREEKKTVPEAEDSILGETEPVYINSDSDEGEPLSKQHTQQVMTTKSKPKPKLKAKKESDVKMRIENTQPLLKETSRSSSPDIIERRETRRKRPPSPKRTTRQNRPDNFTLSDLQGLQISRNLSPKPGPKSMRKDRERQKDAEKESETKKTEDSLLALRSKRLREKEVTVDAPPAKKTKLTEPAKPEKISKPGGKVLLLRTSASKEAPFLPPPKPPTKPPPKAGPKSKMREPSPMTTPKSKKQEVLPKAGPKSKKQELFPVPGLKSKKQEVLPVPNAKISFFLDFGPKSKKQEVLPVTTSKAKKREVSPALSTSKSKKREPTPPPSKAKKREASPPKLPRASPSPPKSFDCRICGTKNKTSQGLSSHIKIHSPLFTPPKLACNACELWFSTSDEATWHHRRHKNKSLPYTCSKCYDDFRTLQDYELHFTRNHCLPTYEVPDVKCDDCWGLFPTYKLLEDHNCPGDAGRPGGKCSRCSRSYPLLKQLIAHEIRCNVKKKGEPVVDPEVSKKMLPMQVRISRCDSLLKNGMQGHYDVSKVSHRFGLDDSYAYPYLYSMGDGIKSEPAVNEFDHMVSINDDIKEEFLNNDDDYVHWDSDASEGADSADLTRNLPFKTKKIDSLCTLSIKTIFSLKCLGKLPKRKRNIKSEKAFDSILSIGFHGDLRKNIDHIIHNLGDESQNDNYDSDTILDKGKEQKEVRVLDSSRTNIDIIESTSTTIETVNGKRISDNTEKREDNLSTAVTNKFADDQSTDSNPTQDFTPSLKDQNRTDHHKEDPNVSNTNSNEDKLVSPQKPVSTTETNTNNKLGNKLTSDPKNGRVVSDKLIVKEADSSPNDDGETSTLGTKSENMDVDEQNAEIKSNNGIINSVAVGLTENRDIEMSDQKQVTLHDKNDDAENDSQSDVINDKKDNSNNDDSQSDEIDFTIFNSDEKEDNDSQSSEVISYRNDLNDADKDDSQSYATNDGTNHADNTKTDLENDTEATNTFDFVNNDSIDRIENHSDTTKADSEIDSTEAVFGSPKPQTVSTDKVNDKNDETNASNSIHSKENAILGDILESSLQSSDRFNINDLNEDDKKLMAELDAQIGENEPKALIGGKENQSAAIGANEANSDVIGENYSVNSDVKRNDDYLNEMIEKRDADLKSLDLDSISDEEFDFDI